MPTTTSLSATKIPTLADRMKQYETLTDIKLPPDKPVILRLDGHGFSRFTKSFNKPFDERIHDAMIETSKDLLKYLDTATVAYTQSDEITLVFPNGVRSFNDRVQKLASLAAAYCSVRFGWHLRLAMNRDGEIVREDVEEKIGAAHFDARFFAVPSVEEALNCLLWRCKMDAVRNAVSAFALSLFSDKECYKKSIKEMKGMIEDKTERKFEECVPKWAVEGCLVKREQYEHDGMNLKTGMKEVALRTRTRVEERGVMEFSEENLRLVAERFW
ncbi:tRNAHis guanylyltransferase-domain-containing protein [Lophiotrema nucula]|uniref:tRNA(His) guanylyltransferase n=1 Tax=Lophiotrema nucula TaxID=690887 RepID=A0A6A5Z9H8_9PLEO|nr:tRNAHis guanylyltransferase-domain-containing protein [Lophiotrema nucula]